MVEAHGRLPGHDSLSAALTRAGLPPADGAGAAGALDHLVLGSAPETVTAGFTRVPDGYRPDCPAPAGRGGGPTGPDERGFEPTLRLLLNGLGGSR